jgi:hypothetical protein
VAGNGPDLDRRLGMARIRPSVRGWAYSWTDGRDLAVVAGDGLDHGQTAGTTTILHHWSDPLVAGQVF